MKAYPDRTYEFVVKPPPTSWFIKRCVGKAKTTNLAGHVLIDRLALKAVYEIALIKNELDPDFKNLDIETICKVIFFNSVNCWLV
jgi:large subunit ribosomal protein L11